ncbi:TetR/AcrR family transcriptional regulator [Actinomadura harenae]|uniref:TetR/AcrR family transcriptional regulator n=1 Tax=Actinomadura harenae TaxID=2483351 RepID=A0A3M2LGL9_9ACTN|nr:TetR/AcrR family transcriptional regulator [Actinomadura harenae]RMI35930.1 TetR/AcrR family transcriptional regulator [Actinomadura harenae]
MPHPHIARRPKRADGARNYDAILGAARRAFERDGAEASLEDVASGAGVAIGTLYRHFPSRASLVEATTRDGLSLLVDRAEELSAGGDPLAALTAWTDDAVRHFSTFRGLVGILTQSWYDEGTPSHTMCDAMHRSGAGLLRAAQAAGRIRADLTPDELFDILLAAAWLRENATPERDGSARFLVHALEGIAV